MAMDSTFTLKSSMVLCKPAKICSIGPYKPCNWSSFELRQSLDDQFCSADHYTGTVIV